MKTFAPHLYEKWGEGFNLILLDITLKLQIMYNTMINVAGLVETFFLSLRIPHLCFPCRSSTKQESNVARGGIFRVCGTLPTPCQKQQWFSTFLWGRTEMSQSKEESFMFHRAWWENPGLQFVAVLSCCRINDHWYKAGIKDFRDGDEQQWLLSLTL